MKPELLRAIASAVLYLHFAVIVFNIFWMLAVPVGAWQGWAFVRSFWWRAAHLASLAVVALQAAVGYLCFLTIWQSSLVRAAGGPSADPPLLEALITRAVFWPLPWWAFVALYIAAFAYSAALWWIVPPLMRNADHR